MFNNTKKMFGWVLALSFLAGFTACTKDDAPADEWTSNYVYIERPHLGMDMAAFTQSHSSIGVAGDVDIQVPVKVKLVEAADCDVKITLTVEKTDGVLPAEVASFQNGGVLTIRKGEVEAVETVVFTKDWEQYYTDEPASTTFAIKIASIEPEKENLRLSTKYNAFTTKISKSIKMDVLEGYPEGEKLDRSGWKSYTNYSGDINGSYSRQQQQPLDGDNGSYIFSGTTFCFMVDMLEEKEITGFELYSAFGGVYITRDVDIQISSDGNDWKSITKKGGLSLTDLRQYQRIKLAYPMKTRFIRMRLGGSPALSEFQIFGK